MQVENLDGAYGAVQVVWGVSLRVEQGKVVSLIGPNGAGKTTTLRVLAGLLPAKNGRICFRGQDVTKEPSHKRVERKLSLIPEERQRSEEHTSELQSRLHLVCRLLLEKKKKKK